MATGRPGLMARRQKVSAPALSTAALTWSSSPVETPPGGDEEIVTGGGVRQRPRDGAAVVGQDAEIRHRAGEPARSACSMKRFAS